MPNLHYPIICPETFADVPLFLNFYYDFKPNNLLKIDKEYLNILLEDIVERDSEKSFSRLFKVFYPRLVKFSFSYVQSSELAEEVVSDVLLRIWNNRRQSKIDDIEAYLIVAVKNQSLKYIERNSLSKVSVSQQQIPDIGNFIDVFDPERELEIKELKYCIDLAIETLPHQSKEVFRLIKNEGFKYKEVSNIMGLSVRTVETHLVRALKKIDLAITPFIEKGARKKGAKKIISNLFSFFI